MMLAVLALLAATQHGAAPAQVDCAEPVTQLAMNICAARDYETADGELNAQWSATAAIMRKRDSAIDRAHDSRPGYFQTMLEAQRAWLRFRDAHCTSEGFHARGGSMEPMLVSSCKAELTRQRTAQLRALADWGH